jgi:predicted RNA-binding Zn-ribbon protein involved in translation (DUF1610 family)
MKSSEVNKMDKNQQTPGVNSDFICPKCGGNMIFDVEITFILPTMYHHNCDKCRFHKNLYEKNNRNLN